MVRVKSDFSYFVGEPIDVYVVPEPAEADAAAQLRKVGGDASRKTARFLHNIVADALIQNLDGGGEAPTDDTSGGKLILSPNRSVKPFGMCLIVSGGLLEADTETTNMVGISKYDVCKLLSGVCQIRLGGISAHNNEKMEALWKQYDIKKGDELDVTSDGDVKVVRGGCDLEAVSHSEGGIVFPEESLTTTESRLKFVTLKGGVTGSSKAGNGSVAKVHYCGWLDRFESKKKFDSSRDKGKEFEVRVGAGDVISGWDEVLADMRKGERRMVVIPAHLAYGKIGVPGAIPPDSALYFDIEMINFHHY